MLPACCMARIIFILLNSGKPCHKQVPSPAILGQAKDVPLLVAIVLEGVSTTAFTPTEAISGFTCPSAEGPNDEELATTPLVFTEPTATTLSPSEGTLKNCVDASMIFPTELKTIIPFFAARSAAMLLIAMFPFRSL